MELDVDEGLPVEPNVGMMQNLGTLALRLFLQTFVTTQYMRLKADLLAFRVYVRTCVMFA